MYVLLQIHNSVQEVLGHASLLKLMEERRLGQPQSQQNPSSLEH